MSRIENLIEIPEVKVLVNMEKTCCGEVYFHSLRVAEYTEIILEEYGKFSEEQCKEIIKGALLHDIGKLFIPFNVTEFPRQLTDNEFEIVKIHTNLGFEIVEDIFSETVSNIVRYHHEKPDGTGYTSRISLIDIPEEVLVVQIADIYDALTSNRPYKNSYEKSKALSIMKQDAENFKLDDLFLNLLEKGLNRRNTRERLYR